MKRVDTDFDYEVQNENDEIDVKVNYKCWINDFITLYPMEVTGSIYKGYSLDDFKKEGKKDYESQYLIVEIVDVFIDTV